MDFVNSACARAVVAKNQLKNKLVRDFRAAKAGELSGQGLIDFRDLEHRYRYRLRCLVAELLAFFGTVRFPKTAGAFSF